MPENPKLAAFRLACLKADWCRFHYDRLPAETQALPAYKAALDFYINEYVKAREAWRNQ